MSNQSYLEYDQISFTNLKPGCTIPESGDVFIRAWGQQLRLDSSPSFYHFPSVFAPLASPRPLLVIPTQKAISHL